MMQAVEPHRMRGLELLSTVLWQLKKEVELAHLAQKVVDFDRLSPEAWCVVGNCFSLQKEHETALIFLPACVYRAEIRCTVLRVIYIGYYGAQTQSTPHG